MVYIICPFGCFRTPEPPKAGPGELCPLRAQWTASGDWPAPQWHLTPDTAAWAGGARFLAHRQDAGSTPLSGDSETRPGLRLWNFAAELCGPEQGGAMPTPPGEQTSLSLHGAVCSSGATPGRAGGWPRRGSRCGSPGGGLARGWAAATCRPCPSVHRSGRPASRSAT